VAIDTTTAVKDSGRISDRLRHERDILDFHHQIA
jgi:hypothetical protein